MKLVRCDDNGYEWACDTCGRTVLFGNHKMKVLVNGNNSPEVIHHGASSLLDLVYFEVEERNS